MLKYIIKMFGLACVFTLLVFFTLAFLEYSEVINIHLLK